jgi:hypothetical protein
MFNYRGPSVPLAYQGINYRPRIAWWSLWAGRDGHETCLMLAGDGAFFFGAYEGAEVWLPLVTQSHLWQAKQREMERRQPSVPRTDGIIEPARLLALRAVLDEIIEKRPI